MRLTVLGSGSTGNAVLICAGRTRVLVDAGLSAKETVRRLALVGEDVTTLVAERLRGCAAIVIESNHSRDMLKACEVYPWELKQRILSRTGHLSNEDVAEWLRAEFDGAAEHVVLAHLSQRANNPDLAKFNAESALRERGGLFQTATKITLSHHKEPTPWIEL